MYKYFSILGSVHTNTFSIPGCALSERSVLTDEVDCDRREFGLVQSIIKSLLFNAALDMRIQNNAGQFRILDQALERNKTAWEHTK